MPVSRLLVCGNNFTLPIASHEAGTLTPPNSKHLLGDTADEPNCPYVELVTIR